MFNGVLFMSLENTGDKERRNQIESLKSKKEVLLLKQRRKEVLATKSGLEINRSRKAELIKLRNKIISYGGCYSADKKQNLLGQLNELEKRSNTLSETQFQQLYKKIEDEAPDRTLMYIR